MSIDAISIETSVLDSVFRQLEDLTPTIHTAARIAINDTMDRKGMALLREKILQQTAFPAGYFKLPKRLYVKQKAYNDNLEGVIEARGRATSLARFVQGSPGFRGKQGLKVQVNPGAYKAMPGAFLLRLNAGAGVTQDNFNVGLAVRLKPGQALNKRSSTQLGHNLHLLYAPSVDQNFRDVAEEQSPAVADLVEEQFWRQFDRLRGRSA